MQVNLRAWLKRDPESGQITIYGHSENDDEANRSDFDQFGIWEPGHNDQEFAVEIDVELPDPKPAPKIRLKATVA